ncbi:bifunctional class I SAM-dependent methyltransferase/glycosyltransferase [Erwinia pyrifoliae]|uniref:bifunctional class I SAM-dependent methyltransferase/glycosyltransferase n=1 Tax=Erwinia pyrifoliae TaxID=79967 RepID=UPI000CDBCC82|nr:bifunctional class I SAM-dependent methyltransferase/glycosyltransferase [Erwinia pyrifoliae]AUX73495.1 UDP-N-acetylglucosamine-peptide N-acetylglucosaminyltransferase [Erwinia pyrifoliae]MCA8876204.1 methyltransferase domain-containing protein [Erwinia pyrifoliae]UXK11459.1 methyltransferase domain-containing protein [Erwinia pyrifoliae]
MNTLYASWHYSPAAIASAACLYRFTSVDISTASVLEVGCAGGGNLLRHAAAYPQSICVGIDIDAGRIAEGVRQTQEAALNNLHFYCLGLQDLLSIEVGKFDYIIIPSMYNMLDAHARSALINWCRRQLSPDGVIALCWSTQPGARTQQQLRQAIAYHCRPAQTEPEWLASARGMLSFIEMSEADGALKQAAGRALTLTDAELLGQFLEDNQDACLLSDFAVRVNAEQLQLLGDVVPQYEMAEYYGDKVAMLQQAVAPASDPLQLRQYLDFAVMRSERFSLLVAQKSAQTFSDKPDLNQLAIMHWAASCMPGDDEHVRITRYGEKVDASHPAIRRILDWLSAAWPRSLSTEQLIRLTLEPESPDDHREVMLAALQTLFINKQPSLYLSSTPSPYNSAAAQELQPICTYSEAEAGDAALCVRTNWWGERLAFKQQEHALWQRGLTIENEQDARLALALAGKGLLSGDALSWSRFWQRIYSCGDQALLNGCMRAYLLATSAESAGGMLTSAQQQVVRAAKLVETVNPKKARKAEELLNAGYMTQAKEAITALLAEHADDATFLLLAAATFNKCGDYATASSVAMKRLALNGDCLPAITLLASIVSSQDSTSPLAKILFHHLLKLDDANSELWLKLSGLYNSAHDLAREERCLQKAIQRDADNAINMLRMATLYSHTGRLEEAKALCRKALKGQLSAFTRANAQAMYVFILSHDAALTAEEKFLAHRQFGQLAQRWARAVMPTNRLQQPRDEREKIRIGFVSGDLNSHPVHHFVWPVWKTLNRERYELYAYATGKEDAVTEGYQSSASVFRHVAALNAVELARQISQDGIDVLIDLSGFTNGNRLLSFALKPAPIQMSWIGFVGTTGLQEMDYYIVYHGMAEPGELDSIFSEKLVSLPSAKLFEYYATAPAINPLPALKNGHLTLGNFNRPQKLTPELLDCWANILLALPDARLLFGFMADQQMSDRYLAEMTRRGVKPEQLAFRSKQNFAAYMAMHQEVDILLDSHPYSAGTTAQHAVWMGVPLITAIEGSAVSRTTAMAMKTLNLDEFVCHSLDEYAQKVIAWNSRYQALDAIRRSMRARIAQRENAHSHNAYYFEQMIDAVWQRHLAGQPPAPLSIADAHRWDKPDAI